MATVDPYRPHKVQERRVISNDPIITTELVAMKMINNEDNDSWEVFQKQGYRSGHMMVSFYQNGLIGLSRTLCALLASDTVEILYNKKMEMIGIRATASDNKNGFRLRLPPRQSSSIVNMSRFLKHYDLDRVKGKQYPASYENGMIVIDISRGE